MSSHVSHAYLSSCLKVPVDPCSNCPAPIYNRPKMVFGSTTPIATAFPKNTKHCKALAMEARSYCNGIRTLAKFYDSIPDYRELNHLSEAEFYSTLDTLRSTCRQLKDTNNEINREDYCSTTTTTVSSLTSSSGDFGGSRCKKSKKSKKKTKSVAPQNNRKCSAKQESINAQVFSKTNNVIKNKGEKIRKSCQSSSSNKRDIDKEVEEFNKTLQKFEAEFKRPSTALNQNENRSQLRSPLKEYIEKTNKDNKNLTDDSNKNKTEKVPVRSTFTSELRERLRKSLSHNDLHTLTEPIELSELRRKNKTLEHLSFKGYKNTYEDSSKLSHYFLQNTNDENTSVPKITVNSPKNSEKSCGEKKFKKKQNKNKEEEYKMAFTVFDLEPNKKGRHLKHFTPSPVHPVARPNLAATLRLESSKKKVNELKNNCTYHDTTPQFDWEVRKTPAWKTLSLNESHKEILRLRLATRKAEQELQQREYELNMELMRQRVKSAPLLLEGPTYWGPHVGKLSHACQKEGRRHMCQSNQQRTKRKKNSSRSQSCRRSLILGSSSALDCENVDCSPQTYRVQMDSRMSHKLNSLCKIYGGNGTRSRSRNSIHSTNSQQSTKNHVQKNSGPLKTNNEKSMKDNNECHAEIDSNDELSSYDRAFL